MNYRNKDKPGALTQPDTWGKIHRVWKKERLPECGGSANKMGVLIGTFYLNGSPETPRGVLQCEGIMLQNDTLLIL